MSEDAIEAACFRELLARGGVGVQTTGVTVTGTPDLLGAYAGRALAWEFKTPRGRVSKVQALRLRQWARAGAQAAVVRSVGEARVLLDELEAGAGWPVVGQRSVRWVVDAALMPSVTPMPSEGGATTQRAEHHADGLGVTLRSVPQLTADPPGAPCLIDGPEGPAAAVCVRWDLVEDGVDVTYRVAA